MESENIFIKKIIINKVRHLESFEIPISVDSKKHLIITGKNGSGKTSLLTAIARYIQTVFYGNYNPEQQKSYIESWRQQINRLKEQLKSTSDPKVRINYSQQITSLEQNIKTTEEQLKENLSVELVINNAELISSSLSDGNFIIDVEQFARNNQQQHVEGSKNISFKKSYQPQETLSNLFAQFLTNQRMDMLNDREESDTENYNKTKEWFEHLESMFRLIYDEPTLNLKFNKTRRIYEIIQSGKEPFGLHEMSSGYAAYFKLVTELLLRMNILGMGNYRTRGICIIDEIETHLHIDLQRQALPFLTQFFPNIQFIVTTHSPFVVNSIENAVAFDLENRILISDNPAKFSGETITELYFRSDLLSNDLKTKLEEFNVLADIQKPDEEQIKKWQELAEYFSSISNFLNEDIKASLRAIKLKSII